MMQVSQHKFNSKINILNLLTRSTMYGESRLNVIDSIDSEFSFSNFKFCNEYDST